MRSVGGASCADAGVEPGATPLDLVDFNQIKRRALLAVFDSRGEGRHSLISDIKINKWRQRLGMCQKAVLVAIFEL